MRLGLNQVSLMKKYEMCKSHIKKIIKLTVLQSAGRQTQWRINNTDEYRNKNDKALTKHTMLMQDKTLGRNKGYTGSNEVTK